jgi:hypothetical protein
MFGDGGCDGSENDDDDDMARLDEIAWNWKQSVCISLFALPGLYI